MTKRFVVIENDRVQNVVVSAAAMDVNWYEHATAEIGWHFNGTEFNPPPESDKTKDLEQSIRQKRNSLLISSDWTQVADAPVDKSAWASYRQQLRDITQQAEFPDDVTWPQMPEKPTKTLLQRIGSIFVPGA